jgi:hypothetical protein
MLGSLLAVLLVLPPADSSKATAVLSRASCHDASARPAPVIRFAPSSTAGDAAPVLRRLTFAPAVPCLRTHSHPRLSSVEPASLSRAAQGSPRVVAFEYSDGYRLRAKIHKVASFATLPLVGAEAYLGQRLFNNLAQAGTTMRKLHRDVAEAIGGLFALNSVTGVWNMISARKDPNGLVLRTIHSVLMLVADGGFVATAFTRPKISSEIYDSKKNQHMALAYASISVATVGYLVMLFGK